MRRIIMLAIACLVVDQLKAPYGWLTTCKGIEVNGEVVLERQIRPGQCVKYRPYILPKDETIHGEITAAPCEPAKEEITAPPSRDEPGKEP